MKTSFRSMIFRFLLIPLLIITFVLLSPLKLKSQFENMTIEGGLITTNILFNNPAAKTINPHTIDTTTNSSFGGGYAGAQSGIGVKLNLTLDEKKRFVLPIGIDYMFYRSSGKYPAGYLFTTPSGGTNSSTLYIDNSSDVLSIFTGLNYFFMKFPIANARAYFGLEARCNFITNCNQSIDWVGYIDITNGQFIDTTITKNKLPAFRLGGVAKLGIEGEISAPVFINVSASLNALNLLFRDNARGELLTPNAKYELTESLLVGFNINLMLQYRFN